MIRALRDFLDAALKQDDGAGAPGPARVEVAAAVLMVEISLADSELDDAERAVIEEALCRHFHMPAGEAREIMAAAEKEVDHAVSLYEYTRLINDRMNADDKVRILERLWEVAFADAVLDKHEEYYIRKIADLLYIPHVNLVKTRHRASRSGG